MGAQQLLVRVREDGVVEPIGSLAQQLLQAQTGCFRLVPASAGVFVLRHANEDGTASGPAVLLAGELRRPGALAEPANAIVAAGWDGELVVVEGLVQRTIFFRAGAIVGAQSNAAAERIGGVMVRLGMLRIEQARDVIGRLRGDKKFGELAVELGYATRERVFDALRRQVEHVLAGAVAVRDGVFAFVEGLDLSKVNARCHLDGVEALASALAARELLATNEAGPVDESVSQFNEAISAVFDAVAMHGKMGLLRASLDAFAAGSPIDRAIFSIGRVAPDGTVDARDVAETLLRLGVGDAAATLRKRFHEYLVYALFVASSELTRDEERVLLARIEPSMHALSARASRASGTMPVSTSLPSSSRTPASSARMVAADPVKQPLAKIALKRVALDRVPAPATTSATTNADATAVARATPESSASSGAPRSAVASHGEAAAARAPETLREVRTREAPIAAEPPRSLPRQPAIEAPPVESRVATPAPRRRGRSSFLVGAALVLAALAGGAVAAVRSRLSASARPEPTVAPSPLVVSSSAAAVASESAVASAPSAASSPASTVGTIRAADSGGHRVWIDGRLVGETPQSFEVACGHHVVRVGSTGQPQMVDVPCGGEIVVGMR